MIGVVTGYTVGPNKDGTAQRILLQVQFDPGNVKTIELFQGQGEDYNPATGSRVYVTKVSDSYKIAGMSCDNIAPEALPGEKEIYSTDELGTVKLGRIKLSTDGLINISNTVESLIGLVEDLIDAINDIETYGSSTQHFIHPDSILALTAIKVRFALLFED